MTTEKINSEPKIIYDYDPRNLPPEYLRAIGLVITASSQTESVLQDLIGALLGIDNIQAIALTTHLSFPLKQDIIKSIAELGAPNVNELDKIDELLERVKEGLDMRNIIAHNSFAKNPHTGEILSRRVKARGSLQLDLKPITHEEIEETANLIYESGMEIVRFMMSRGLEPIPRTKPLRQAVNRSQRARKDRKKD